jgi:hypothetical protein
MKLFIIKFSPLPCYLVPLRPKYSPQHPILKHPQPTFLPQCQRPSFTPTDTHSKRNVSGLDSQASNEIGVSKGCDYESAVLDVTPCSFVQTLQHVLVCKVKQSHYMP